MKPQHLTPELKQAIKDKYDGSTEVIDALVNEFKVPRHTVINAAKRMGVTVHLNTPWTAEDENFLVANWSKGLEYCAKKLNRSPMACKAKGLKLELGGCFFGSHYLTGQDVAELTGVDACAVRRWMGAGLLKHRMAPSDRRIHFVQIPDLEQFLKNNPDEWDSRKMKGSLWLQDPEWLIVKKVADNTRPKNEGKKWTKEENKQLITLFKTGKYTHREMGDLLGRSKESIDRRLARLDVWGTGEFIGARWEREGNKRRHRRSLTRSVGG